MRGLAAVVQLEVAEVMPTGIPPESHLFATVENQSDVAERLLVKAHYDLAQKIIEFLGLSRVEIYVRASNQVTTLEARAGQTVGKVVEFLEAVRRLPPAEWDSLVSNVINIWLIEKGDRSRNILILSQFGGN